MFLFYQILLCPLFVHFLIFHFSLLKFRKLAHNPLDTTIASGVASPSEHGHATTSIVTNVVVATPISFPINKYTIKVIILINITIGTKKPEIVSATFAIGAFVLLASTTSLTISEIVESFPIFSALYSIYPS